MLIPFKDGSQKFGYMDSDLPALSLSLPSMIKANRFVNGGMAVIRSGDKYGFVREDGKVITPKYDMVTFFLKKDSVRYLLGEFTKMLKMR